jgi:hypothetical protein
LPCPNLIEIERANYVLASARPHSPLFAIRPVFVGDLRGPPLFRCSADLRGLLNHHYRSDNHRQGTADGQNAIPNTSPAT